MIPPLIPHGLETADDRAIWDYAKEQGFTLVSQDADFHELATLYGPPPRLIWLKCGNKPRWYVASLLLKYRERIEAADADPETAVVEIAD